MKEHRREYKVCLEWFQVSWCVLREGEAFCDSKLPKGICLACLGVDESKDDWR